MLEFMLTSNNSLVLGFIVAYSSGLVNDSKQPAVVSLNSLSMFDNALTMF